MIPYNPVRVNCRGFIMGCYRNDSVTKGCIKKSTFLRQKKAGVNLPFCLLYLSFGLAIRETISPERTATVTPPAHAESPPVMTPIKPSF